MGVMAIEKKSPANGISHHRLRFFPEIPVPELVAKAGCEKAKNMNNKNGIIW